MVKLRKALVVLPGDGPDEVALGPNSHGYAIYLGESPVGSLRFVRAGLGVPRALQDQGRGGNDLPNSPRTGKKYDREDLRKYCHGAAAARRGTDLIDHPSARVAVSESSGQLGVRVWKPQPVSKPPAEQQMSKPPAEQDESRPVLKLEGRVDEAFRETFDQVLAETFLGAIWPAPASTTGTLQNFDSLSRAAEYVLEPETLLLKGINAAAQAAAHAATFGPLASFVGKLAENFCAPLLRPSAERQADANMVKIIDIDLYADDGRLPECTTLRDLTVEQAANVIGNSLESRPGTPIQPGSPGDGPARPGSPGDLPVQPAPDGAGGNPYPWRRANPRRGRSQPDQQPPERGQGRPSRGSGR